MSRYIRKRTAVAAAAVVTAVVLLLGTVSPLQLAHANTQNGAGFSVRALLPDNQLNERLSYFDLRMKPEQVQQLEVEITNESDKPILVSVHAVSASTNRNGIIDYKTPGIRDTTLEYPFSDIALVDTPSVLVEAKSSSIAAITLHMPEESYDGIVLGGLVFTGEQEEKEQQQSVAVNNVFSYVIGAKLSVTDTEVHPNFEIVEATPQVVNYQPMFVHAIRNTEAALAKNIDISVSVENSKGEVKAQITRESVDMAPNSVMPLGLSPDDGKFVPGDYVSNIEVGFDGKTYHYLTEFTVNEAKANEVNSLSIDAQEPSGNGIDMILIGIIAALLAIIVILLLVLFKKRKSSKEQQE